MPEPTIRRIVEPPLFAGRRRLLRIYIDGAPFVLVPEMLNSEAKYEPVFTPGTLVEWEMPLETEYA